MTHGHPKVIMPISAVKCMSLRCEETCPWDAREFIIIGIREEIAITHVFGRILFKNSKITLWCFCRKAICSTWTVRYSRRDSCFEQFLIILISSQGLHGQIDFDALLFKRDIRCNWRHLFRRDRTHVLWVDVIYTCQIIIDAIPWLSRGSWFNCLHQMSGLIIQTKTKLLPAVGLASSPRFGKWNGHFDHTTQSFVQAEGCQGFIIENLDTLQVRAMKISSPHSIPNRVMCRFINGYLPINME